MLTYLNKAVDNGMKVFRDLLARFNNQSSLPVLSEKDVFTSIVADFQGAGDVKLKRSVKHWKCIEELHFKMLELERIVAYFESKPDLWTSLDSPSWVELQRRKGATWRRLQQEARALLSGIYRSSVIPERYLDKLTQVNHLK
jgi:hypothetical protein